MRSSAVAQVPIAQHTVYVRGDVTLAAVLQCVGDAAVKLRAVDEISEAVAQLHAPVPRALRSATMLSLSRRSRASRSSTSRQAGRARRSHAAERCWSGKRVLGEVTARRSRR